MKQRGTAIARLADDVVARIAAGEAMERPASAVKELVENAIDAGASAVHVETAGGGKKLIRVADNGSGIRGDELELAFARHATSKLRSTEDLQRLATLGFRGEALASIAAVSRTGVITRHRDEAVGASLRVVGGAIESKIPVGAPAGTVITVENLFFNTPARLKFLKAERTEKRHIHTVLTNYAMAYPGIAFSLTQGGREVFRSSGGGALADVAAAVFGRENFKRMITLDADGETGLMKAPLTVSGYISIPELKRADRGRMVMFVNGRAARDGALSHALISAYEGLLPKGAFPLALILIELPPEAVDVNVHPTKAEVRFRDPHRVFVALQRAARQALQNCDAAPPSVEAWTGNGANGHEPAPWAGPEPWRGGSDAIFDDVDLPHISHLAAAPAYPRTLPILRVVGQIGATYIVAEGPAGLYLIDQNAAHERVLFAETEAARLNGGLPCLNPEETQTALLSPEDSRTLEAVASGLAGLGFEIEPFGPNAYVFRALPSCLDGLDAAEALRQILERLRRGREPSDFAAALALAGAVKRGQVLSADEMAALVAKLERCATPLQSPSGKKTLIHLTRDQLADEFRRG